MTSLCSGHPENPPSCRSILLLLIVLPTVRIATSSRSFFIFLRILHLEVVRGCELRSSADSLAVLEEDDGHGDKDEGDAAEEGEGPVDALTLNQLVLMGKAMYVHLQCR